MQKVLVFHAKMLLAVLPNPPTPAHPTTQNPRRGMGGGGYGATLRMQRTPFTWPFGFCWKRPSAQ